MQKTIEEGRQFVNSIPRKVPKTKTMAEVAGEKSAPKKKAIKKKAVIKKSIAAKKPSTKASPTKVVKTTSKASSKKGAKLSVKGSKSSVRSEKKVLFKSKSKDLPLSAFGFIDVCFCLDATGSMCSELAQAQSTIKSLIKKIQEKVATEGINLRFAIVDYRDHPPQDHSYVTHHLDFTDQHEAIEYVNKLTAGGGGDEPEAVHDALLLACKSLKWAEVVGTPSVRYIFHIADAPPHGKEFGNFETNEGCLCGKTTA